MNKDGDLQCNFFNSKILLDYWHQLLCQKSGKKVISRDFEMDSALFCPPFYWQEISREGISAVVMLLHLEGKLFYSFVR